MWQILNIITDTGNLSIVNFAEGKSWEPRPHKVKYVLGGRKRNLFLTVQSQHISLHQHSGQQCDHPIIGPNNTVPHSSQWQV